MNGAGKLLAGMLVVLAAFGFVVGCGGGDGGDGSRTPTETIDLTPRPTLNEEERATAQATFVSGEQTSEAGDEATEQAEDIAEETEEAELEATSEAIQEERDATREAEEDVNDPNDPTD